MPSLDSLASQPPTPREQEVLNEVLQAIRELRFGHVQVIVQDAQVVQIETLEKRRIGRSHA